MIRRALPTAIVALALSFSCLAYADDEVDPNALRAEKLAAEADTKQAAGAHAEAIELYQEANKTSPAAIFLFNIARLYDTKLGAPSLALDYYRRSVAAGDLEDALSNDARRRIAELEKKSDSTPPGKVEPPSERGWHPLAIAGVASAGAGLLSLGTSGILALVAKSKDSDASAFCDGDRCTDARAIELTNDAEDLANAATVTFVIGAVLAAGGVVLWLVAPSAKQSAVRSGGIRF